MGHKQAIHGIDIYMYILIGVTLREITSSGRGESIN